MNARQQRASALCNVFPSPAEPLYLVLFSDLFASDTIDIVRNDAIFGGFVDRVKANLLGLASRGLHGDRERHEGEFEIAFPVWTYSMMRTPSYSVR